MDIRQLKKLDLRRSPKCPYGDLVWNRYYWEKPRTGPEYEADYWSRPIDPDGKKRDMLSKKEWGHQVADIRWIADMINRHTPGKLIDVGCGPGYFLSAIDSKWKKFGVDVSRLALEKAKDFADVSQGQFTKLKFKPDTFDVAFMYHVIEHVGNPIEYIQKVHRILKPGGLCIIGTPDFDSGCARRFKNKYRMLHDTGHISLFTSFSLVKMLEDHGFRILDVEYPFFNSIWFTKRNLLRMLDQKRISPPFYGNHIVVFSEKRTRTGTNGWDIS